MMINRHLLISCLAASFLSAFAVSELRSQSVSPDPMWGDRRVTVEGFYNQYRFDGRSGDDRLNVDGIGGRLMWRLAPWTARESSTFGSIGSRTALGAFAVYTPDQDLGFTTWHVGAQAEVEALPQPLFGRLDPVFSLGAGALRTDVRGTVMDDIAIANRTNTRFTLAPAFGARLAILPNAGLRADLQNVIAFRGGSFTHNPALLGGLSVTF